MNDIPKKTSSNMLLILKGMKAQISLVPIHLVILVPVLLYLPSPFVVAFPSLPSVVEPVLALSYRTHDVPEMREP